MQTASLFQRVETRRAFTACLLFILLAAGLLPGATPARAAEPAQYFAVPLPSLLFPTCAQADPCTLQAAVDKAADGDTIYASGGTYTSTADQVLNLNKSVIIRGGWNGLDGRTIVIDPTRYPTILNGGDTREVIHILGDVSPTLIGLTIEHGLGDYRGGGMLAETGTGGSIVITDCLFDSNHATTYGGAIYLSGGTLTVTDSTFHDNDSVYGGGAILLSGTTLLIAERVIAADNTASYGSFIHSDGGSISLRGSSLSGQGSGSGVITVNANGTNYVTLENNLFIQNAATLLSQSGNTNSLPVAIRHNTMVNNTQSSFSLYAVDSGSISNNIFSGFGGAGLNLPDGSPITVDHNLFWANGSNPDTGTGAILQDPLLTDDYHLGSGSPAIDAAVTIGGVVEDYDRDPRPIGSAPDIGADERRLYGYLPLVMKP